MDDTLIEIKKLRKAFAGREVLRGVDIDIPQGGITAIIGKSGEGKSVLLKNIVGLLTPDSGQVLFRGQSLREFKSSRNSGQGLRLSYMFQGMALFDSLTVFENVALPLSEKTRLPKSEIAAKVRAIMDELELFDVGAKYPSQISGGMQKRVALARALVTQPEIVLFDEPTTGLDPIRKKAVLQLIHESCEKFGFTAVIVSHDLEDVFPICRRVVMLDEGEVVFQGTPDEARLCEHPVLREFFAA